jgi:hypothetical protein
MYTLHFASTGTKPTCPHTNAHGRYGDFLAGQLGRSPPPSIAKLYISRRREGKGEKRLKLRFAAFRRLEPAFDFGRILAKPL